MGLFNLFKKINKIHIYSEEAMEQYESYIEEQFGPYTEVFHELVSPDIHLDIIIVPPTDKNPYYKLITMGMGAYKMKVPHELKQYELERAELVLYLPPTWNIKSGNEEDYWPIRQLKALGRLPVQCDTWLGFGHTVSSGQENNPYANNTEFCSMMLVAATNHDYKVLDFRIDSLGKINFYQLFPLYKEELEYKQHTDAETLLELFDDDDILPILNNNRRNYGIT